VVTIAPRPVLAYVSTSAENVFANPETPLHHPFLQRINGACSSVTVDSPRSRRPMRSLALVAAVLGMLLSCGVPAQAQTDPEGDGPTPTMGVPVPLPIPRLTGPIEVDGLVDEPAWDRIDFLPMTMFAPTFGAPISERTEVRIAHDGEYLYVSGRMFDSDPSGIRTNTFYRDQYSGDDLLAVVLDSFNDHETGVWFTTNPAGTRTDRTIANDGVFSGGGSAMNWDWNAHW
jgi:hypothetical protein